MATLVGLYSPVMASGKSTVASALQGHNYVTVKFAWPLKNMLRQLLAIRGASAKEVDRMVEGDLKEVPTPFLDGYSPRHAMQTLGTEWGRKCMGQDFWVNSAMSQVDRILENRVNVVMDDVRFPNEAQAIVDRGGIMVRITRPNVLQVSSEHASEGSLSTWPFDLDLVNDKTTSVQWALHACHEIAVKQRPMWSMRGSGPC